MTFYLFPAVQRPRHEGTDPMRSSNNTTQKRPTTRTSDNTSHVQASTSRRRRWAAAMLAGSIVSGVFGQTSVMGQQPSVARPNTPKAFAPAAGVFPQSSTITTLLQDTAMAGSDNAFPPSLPRGVDQPPVKSLPMTGISTGFNSSGFNSGVVVPASDTSAKIYHSGHEHSGQVHSGQVHLGQVHSGQEPPGTIVSSKIVSTSEPVIVSQQDIGPDGTPISTQVTDSYGFNEAVAMPSSGYGYNQPHRHGGSRPSLAVMSGFSTNRGQNNTCFPEVCRRFYLGYETIYMQREGDQQYSFSQGNFMPNNGYELGHRITLGQMFDCTDGVEFVYTGSFTWERASQHLSPGGNLQSFLTAGGGYTAAQIDTFNDSFRHQQGMRANLQSYEANRKWFAWDIMSTLIGIRAFQYNEQFSFDSVGQGNGAGFFRTDLQNFLLGAQIGSDVMRPISQRLSIGAKSRLGVFANFNEGELQVFNRGTRLIDASRRSTDLAGMIQLGTIGRYRVLPSLVATVGYEAMYLAGVATVSNQQYVLNPGSGTSYDAGDCVLFHGGTFGFEYSW